MVKEARKIPVDRDTTLTGLVHEYLEKLAAESAVTGRKRRGLEALERSFRVLEVRWPRWVQALPGYTVGSLGAFWTVQRLAILFGGAR